MRFVTGGHPHPFKERYNEKAHKDKDWTADEKNNGKAYDAGKDPMTFLNNEVMAPEYLETGKYERAEEAVYKKESNGKFTVSTPT